MPNKVFDIILKSKYAPEGVRGAVAGLKSISEAGFFIRQGLVAPLMEAGRAVFDVIGAANPDRIKQFGSAFDSLKQSVGVLLDAVLGPFITALGDIARGIGSVINWFNEATGAAAAYRAELERVAQTQKLGAGFAEGFAKGLSDIGSVLEGREEFRKAITEARQGVDKAVVDSAKQRAYLVEDIARKEADRLENVSRQNAGRIADINASRAEALQAAGKQLAQSLASIDAESAKSRINIEESYQERIRQIKNDSSKTIDEAIRRRDARALAAAMNQRDEQIGQATRDRDKQTSAEQRSADERKAQAQAQYEQQQKASEDAARKALDTLREQNAEAAREAKIATDRQLRDFDIAKNRRISELQSEAKEEQRIATEKYNELRRKHGEYLDAIATATKEATTRNGSIGQAITDRITEILDEITHQIRSGSATGGRHAVGSGQ